MKIRRTIAIIVAKMISSVCKRSGRAGVTLAGKAALCLDPSILSGLAAQIREKIFVVCGTNGKTTTNNLLDMALRKDGVKTVCNRSGSNMLQGITAAFVLAAKWNGTLEADYACLEVDEASAKKVLAQIRPDYMILTNLFRDQLDRYGEIDITMHMLEQAVKLVPDMTIVVNGDDPLAFYLATASGNPVYTFGIAEQVVRKQLQHEIRDGSFCKKCGNRLAYQFYHFGQMGRYICSVCGFERPQVDFEAANIRTADGLEFEIDQQKIRTGFRGFYNIYNILAVYGVLKTAGLGMSGLEKILWDFRPQNGRMEAFDIDGTKVLLNLAKNPTGFNQNLEAVLEDSTFKDVIIVINDNAADGKDISWLWDVEVDQLLDTPVHSIFASGIRCLDLQLRLKYAGIEAEAVQDVRTAAEVCLAGEKRNLYVLVNYTALQPTRKMLLELQKK